MGVQTGDIIRITAHMSYGAEPILNVYHVRYAGTTEVSNANVVAQGAGWLDVAYDYIDQFLHTNFLFDYIEFWNITQDEPIGNTTWPTLTSGSDSTNQAYATQCAVLLRFTTDVARSQGRKFIGGLTEGAVTSGGLVETAMMVPLNSFAFHIMAGFSYSFEDFQPGNWNPLLSRFATWVTAIINDRVCTQRRRRVGSGT